MIGTPIIITSSPQTTVLVNSPPQPVIIETGKQGLPGPAAANPMLPIGVWHVAPVLNAQLLPYSDSFVSAATVVDNVASMSISSAGLSLGGSIMSTAFSATLKQWLCALPDFSGVNSAIFSADLVIITTDIIGMENDTGPGCTIIYATGVGLQLISQPGNVITVVDPLYTENEPFLMVVTGSTGSLDIITPHGTFIGVTTVPIHSTAYGILELYDTVGSHDLALGMSTDPTNVGNLPIPGDAGPLR